MSLIHFVCAQDSIRIAVTWVAILLLSLEIDLLEKTIEWALPLVIISLDIYKAYDSLCLGAVIGILDHYDIPIRIKYAFLREVLATKKLHLFYGGTPYGHILVNKGFRQGSPEASFVFAIIVAHLLAVLDRSWREKGWGIRLGAWGGNDMSFDAWWSGHAFLFSNLGNSVQDTWLTSLAFLDDVYFTAPTLVQGQLMIDEAIALFGKIGLKRNLTKIKWIANKYVGVTRPS